MSASTKIRSRLVTVMPVGPDDSGADTIASLLQYCAPSQVILAIDDSKSAATRRFLETCDPRVIRLPSAGYPGIRGGLTVNLARAYRYALDRHDFDVLLRIDTDALVTGPAPEDEALARFSADPRLGMLGLHKADYDGRPRDYAPIEAVLLDALRWHGVRRMPRWLRMRRWISAAKARGWFLGEHVLGAAVYLRPELLAAMRDAGDLSLERFHDSVISEDHLFSLVTAARGFTMGEFGAPAGPMGVRWHGLPDTPEHLIAAGMKIVHSIKGHGDTTEADIRRYFAGVRALDASRAGPFRSTRAAGVPAEFR